MAGTGDHSRGRKLPAVLAVSLVILLPLVTALMLVHAPSVADPDGSGYLLEGPSIDTDLCDFSSDVTVTREGLTRISRTPEGLVTTLRQEGDAARLHIDGHMTTVAVSLNISDLVRYQGNVANAEFRFYDEGMLVSALFGMGMHSTALTYTVDDGGHSQTIFSDLLIDRPDDADILVQVTEEGVRTGLNGVEEFQPFDSLAGFGPQRSVVTIGAGNGINSIRDVTVFRLQASGTDGYRYVDTLHKTIVPDGKDLAFSLHIHADKAFIPQFWIMANLSEEYGLRGTYDAWWKGNSQQYGMDSPEYMAALHALQDSGWDIGIHAGSINDLTREQVISAIENLTDEFGAPRTWSDHGLRPQSLAVNGANESSPNYVKDLVVGIGAGWWHDNTQAHSAWNDLNRDGMNYTLEGQEDLPLFRVSKQQALQLFFEDGRQENASSWLRAMPVQRSVFVAHDYFPFFFYVTNGTGSYSVLPEHDGIMNTPWSALRPKTDLASGTWQALPSFVDMLEMMQGYDVWFATVRDVYDRSCLVQKVSVTEEEGRITVTNHNGVAVNGLTLFTRGSIPSYDLMEGDEHLPFEKGTGASWHLILDLGPGEVKVLIILGDEPLAPSLDPQDFLFLAIRETWLAA